MNMIGREEAVWRLKKLEENALDAGNAKAAECYARAFNAIMSCRVYTPGRTSENQKSGGPQAGSSPDR